MMSTFVYSRNVDKIYIGNYVIFFVLRRRLLATAVIENKL